MTMLSANLSAVKGGQPILTDVQIDCAGGECVTILGENGAGKSVLLRALALIEDGVQGSVTVLGTQYILDGADLPEGPWPDLSIVFQSLALWPHLSGGENILLPWRSRGPSRRFSEGALATLFQALEIEHLIDRLPSQMSGGQRQRVALARAIALRPKILLLDEPSAALDARRSLALLSLLHDLKADGTALVMVTHSLGFAAQIADNYAFLHDGGIQAEGPWSSIGATKSEPLQAYLKLNAVSK
jgi:ABC-type polar amino acid transport system ATPase subunit